jgi:hypothetical protein
VQFIEVGDTATIFPTVVFAVTAQLTVTGPNADACRAISKPKQSTPTTTPYKTDFIAPAPEKSQTQ